MINNKCVMKNVVFLLLIFLAPDLIMAQDSVTTQIWNVRYEKEHLLYQKGGEVNVIDVDIEWPNMVYYSNTNVLRKYISTLLFDVADDDFDTAYSKFKNRFGEPVTRQFSTIPDDSKFCYIDCKLKEIGYQPGRYISFDASYTCSPASASSLKGDTISRLFTYDIINDKILLMKDIIKTTKIENGIFPLTFVGLMIANADTFVPESVNSFNLSDAALDRNGVLIKGFFIDVIDIVHFSTIVNFADMDGLLTKNVKNLIKSPIPKRQANGASFNAMIAGEPVYLSVDTMPEYRGGRNAMLQYLTNNVEYPKMDLMAGLQGKVVSSFVIDKNGDVRDVRIIAPVSPEIDRETVKLIKLMPKWKPGRLNGNAVNVRLTVPLQFCLQ